MPNHSATLSLSLSLSHTHTHTHTHTHITISGKCENIECPVENGNLSMSQNESHFGVVDDTRTVNCDWFHRKRGCVTCGVNDTSPELAHCVPSETFSTQYFQYYTRKSVKWGNGSTAMHQHTLHQACRLLSTQNCIPRTTDFKQKY